MITRNRLRTALAELQQQQQQEQQQGKEQQGTQSTTEVKVPADELVPQPPQKPPQSSSKVEKPTPSAELQSADALAHIAKKMNFISLDSGSDQNDSKESEVEVIDLSGSSKSVMDISSSDISSSEDGDGDDSYISEDEDGDGDEGENSEEENHGKEKRSIPSAACNLLAEEVIKLIRGGDLKKLKVDNCRLYLRNHGLRVTGTKPVLIDRIKQHVELKEGGSRNYDRSTFVINCTGDVCKGDVVMFDQKVFDKFDVTARTGAQVGRRTVAGRVVKESYGAQRQQHTFTVEVLWSTGCRPLAPMKQLLVKGRNLYKQRTFRQRWADEGERRRSLDEKHERGAAARHVRAIKQGRFKGYTGTLRAEVQQMKQLANPYTNTLASKENTNFANGPILQSAVALTQTVAVTTQHHLVNSHTSLTVNDNYCADDRTGKLGNLQGAVSQSSVLISQAQSASSSSKYYDQIDSRQILEVTASSEGGSTSLNRHRHWFKPTTPSLVPSNCDSHTQSCGVQNVSVASTQLHGGSNNFQSGRFDSSHQPANRQAPINRVSEGAGMMNASAQRYDRNASSLNRPSSPLLSRPSFPFPNRPSSPHHHRSTSPYPNRPSAPYTNRPSSPYHHRPSSPYLNRPSSPYHDRPSSAYHDRPSSPIQNRPSSPYQNRPYSSYHNTSKSPLSSRPSSAYYNRPSSSLLNRPSSPLPSRSSYLSLNRPSSPLGNGPSYPLRDSSPVPNRPTVSHNLKQIDKLAAGPVRYPNSIPLGVQLCRPVSWGRGPSGTSFPCPTERCTNQGSRYCSSGVCSHCCRKIGGDCSNPKHRPQQNRY